MDITANDLTMHPSLRTIVPLVAAVALSGGPAYTRSAGDRSDATSPEERAAVAATATDILFRIQQTPDIRATVTNWGFFGNLDGTLVDSTTDDSGVASHPAPVFESPSHSRVEYLYEAGLWIGGIVGDDTLVSVGSVGWGQRHELYPTEATPPVLSDSIGDEEYRSTYADSLTDPAVVQEDPVDGAHRPLPVRVHQTTRSVDDPRFSHGLILEVTVANIGTATIRDLWLGWLVDCDIGYLDDHMVWLHDISGFRENTITIDGQEIAIAAAWSADIDGKADTLSGAYNDRSPVKAFGSMYLGGEPRLEARSFNWWVPALGTYWVHDYDWGPQQAPADTNYLGGRGTPMGDAMKYRFMSNGEVDYPQVFASVDRTGEGWIAPTIDEASLTFADGYDTRFLHTVGAATLAPGDSVVAVWAWVAAPGWHSDPGHFETTFDYAAPQPYLDGLGTAHLDTALAQMQIVWESGFERALVGAPRGFTVSGWDDHEARLRWRPRETLRLASYYILRSVEPDPFWGLPIAILNPEDSAYTDIGLERNRTYYYTVASTTSEGHMGPLAPVVDVLPDRPYTPGRPTARRGNASVTLTWEIPSEPDVVGHSIYRRQEAEEWFPVAETSELGSFTDMTAANTVVYEYRIGAVSELGNESFPSDPVIGLAFAFGGLPLVLDHTPSDPSALTLKDSVRVVWERLLGEAAVTYQDADPVTVAPFGLEIYNDHPALVVVADGRFALRPEAQDQLSLYAYAEGALILSGRDLFNDEPIAEGTLTFGPGDFPYDVLGITGAYYPRVLLSNPTRMNAEFLGARAVHPSLSDLAVDSTRTDWGLNPALPSTHGAVPFVGYFDIDTARAEVIYTFVSNQGSASPLHGKPVGIVSRDSASHAAAFAFPLSYVDETQARGVLIDLLRASGWRSTRRGDVNGDGIVTISDATVLVDYLYRGGSLPIPANADVTATDSAANLADVMTILAYVTYGTPLPR